MTPTTKPASEVPVTETPGPAQPPTSAGVTPLPLEYELNPPKVYQVGTLTYTLGGLCILFFWLLFGDFAISMRDRSVGPVVQLMLKQYKASDTLMAILMQVLPPAISVILGPIISYKSDNHRGRWGRRIPFLLIPTPIAALSMVGLAYCPMIGEKVAGVTGMSLNASVLMLFAVFWTLFEFAVITAGAVFGGLINDVVPRQFLGRFFGLFRAVSLTAGMIFNYWLMKWAETHFFEIFVAIGLLFGVGFTIMCLKVREGEYPPVQYGPAGDHRSAGFVGACKIYFRECFSRPYYLWIFFAMLFAALTFAPFNLFSLPYAKALNMDMGDYGKLIAASYFISLCLAYPLGWLVDKFHSLRVGLVALGLYALSVLYGSVFVHDGKTFGVALVAHTVLSGTYFTATASLGQALFPRMKFGQFASAAGVVNSFGNMILGLIIGPMLDWSGSNYRLTFVAGLILCVTTIGLLCVVYARFMNMGGPKGYVAPGDEVTPPVGGFEVLPAKR